ncbi:cytochrome P450 family protein [Mycobacterium xenopi 4042]|uniref:Cytochrome P450 family protein n=1 Tax=Mycobacterium xenopi 4042 TaxID=1299334 RepID=X7Z2K9_MYCXE|nr:cytochrome P450 family protein [Mycobacterium xenopi 4042]
MPRKDYPQFQRWSVALLSILFNRERGLAASEALREYFIPILAARREEPRDDLISGLAQAEIDGEMLSDEEIFSFLRLLLPAGVETTYRSLGNLLFALLSNPDQLDAVRTDRSLIPQAIEEAIRWEPHFSRSPGSPPGTPNWQVCRSRRARRSCRCLARPTGRRTGTRPRPLRHIPSAAGAHRVRPRSSRVSWHALGPAGNAGCAQPVV